MKYAKNFFIILLLLLLINSKEHVLAMNTGFSTEFLTEEERKTFLSNVNISILKEEPQKDVIECFDVNQDGLIAIGLSNFEKKTICIYDGNYFLYGYEFRCNGDFGVEWDENNVNIYFVRSDIIITINSMGEIVDVLRVQDTIENNSYRNYYIYAIKRTVGENKYMLKNNMGILNVFASSYSQLIKVDENKVQTILYDANNKYIVKLVAIIIFVVVFICIAICFVVRQLKNLYLRQYRVERPADEL